MAKKRSTKKSAKPRRSRTGRRRLLARKSDKLNFEALESKQLLAGVTVGNATDLVNAPDTSAIAALIANDGGDGISLREAITAANNTSGADTITFDNSLSGGTITLAGTRLESNGTLTIDASALADGVTLDANGNSRVLVHSGGPSDSITVRGLTLTGGVTEGNGGGLYSYDAEIILENTIITGNTSVGVGGGIQTQGGNITLTGSTVSNNSTSGVAASGGGIATSGGSVTLLSSTISGNTSALTGGGIFTSSGNVNSTNSTISGNQSGGNGGGIYTINGAVLVQSSTITNNTAALVGGGIDFSGTVAGGTLTINNSIIAGNTGLGVAFDFQTPSDPANNLSVTFSLIGTAFGTTLTAAPTADANGNLIGALSTPIDPLLGPLADNGGPTRTHALLVGSPAIEAGNSLLLAADTNDLDSDGDKNESIPFDQRGSGFDRVIGGQIDIGAVERQDIVAPTADIVDVSPDLRNTAAGVVTINFDEEVTGVDISDFTLTRDGVSVDISGLTLTQISYSQYTIDLSSVTSADGNYQLALNSSGSGITDASGNDLIDSAFEDFAIDTTGPTVTSVVVNEGQVQRSTVTSLTVTFSEIVGGIDASSFILTNTTTSTQVTPTVTTSVVGGQTIATLTFSGSGIIGGSLADGNYQLTILDTIADAAGNQLDGDNDGTGGGNATDDFFRLFGDVNGDRAVNILDFGQFRAAFGSVLGSATFNTAFDFNGDGVINILDFGQFRSRFGTSLPPA